MSESRVFELHPGHTWQCCTILATALQHLSSRIRHKLASPLKVPSPTSNDLSRRCTFQVAGDLHVGGRASADSARPSAIGGASAAGAGPDDVRDSQSDGTLIESDLEVRCGNLNPNNPTVDARVMRAKPQTERQQVDAVPCRPPRAHLTCGALLRSLA